MDFGLLGPMVARHRGQALPVRPGKQRALLAALLLDANRVISAAAIAEMLWGAEPPPTAKVTIRNYVKRLRQALGDVGPARIVAQSGGYLINVGDDELDVTRFEGLLTAAHAAEQAGSWGRAGAQARTALALWRGPALADVRSDTLARHEIPRLEELRLQALEIRIDADLRAGAHARLITELRSVADKHPLREGLRARLMLALYRSGRQAEALAAYQQTRLVLVTELGIEPGTELRELHRRVLAGDRTLSVPQGMLMPRRRGRRPCRCNCPPRQRRPSTEQRS